MTTVKRQPKTLKGIISSEEILRVAMPLRKAERALRKLERLLTKAVEHQRAYGGEGSQEAKEMIAQIQGLQDLRDTLDEIWQSKREGKHNPGLLYRRPKPAKGGSDAG